jgi:signal transduction histidine kinase
LLYIVKQNIDLIRESARQKEIQLINKVQPDIEVKADIPMLNTIFRNLISNAVKFTPRGGTVEIGVVRNKAEDSKLTGGFLEVYIRDNGIGISSESIEKLFKIDQKISRPGTEGEHSTGLGLLLCKDFAEKHGGKIWVESEVGIGSTFYFILPIE